MITASLRRSIPVASWARRRPEALPILTPGRQEKLRNLDSRRLRGEKRLHSLPAWLERER